jgi:hypothetical protein
MKARKNVQLQALAKLPPDSDLRLQYEEEINALQAKQTQLGQV